MHVQQAAVLDTQLDPTELRDRISSTHRRIEAPNPSDTLPQISGEVRENLAQISAVACICNSAIFTVDEKLAERSTIVGNATGE